MTSEDTMDRSELSRRAKALPERFADRLDAVGLRQVREDLGAGEWGEGLDNLLAGLGTAGAAITRDERRELGELLEAVGMHGDRLDVLDVRG
ncbi:MAG TPA: hypothetical protein VGL93_00100 [Streptosporangiaceae bacterium]